MSLNFIVHFVLGRLFSSLIIKVSRLLNSSAYTHLVTRVDTTFVSGCNAMTASIGIEPPLDALEKITPVSVIWSGGTYFGNDPIQEGYLGSAIVFVICRAVLYEDFSSLFRSPHGEK